MAQAEPPPQEIEQERLLTAQVTRAIDLGQYTVQILKNTLGNATRSYKFVTYMCVLMFLVGIALFVAGSVDGLFFAHKKVYPLAFAGLGATTFVAIFLTGSIERVQNALSNLVQVEVAFMNFYEQITIWDNYAASPEGDPPRPVPAKFEKASEEVQLRAERTLEMLETFTETHAGPAPPPKREVNAAQPR